MIRKMVTLCSCITMLFTLHANATEEEQEKASITDPHCLKSPSSQAADYLVNPGWVKGKKQTTEFAEIRIKKEDHSKLGCIIL